MKCQSCGQYSDWIGGDSDWERLNGGGCTVSLLECSVCGNRQHKR